MIYTHNKISKNTQVESNKKYKLSYTKSGSIKQLADQNFEYMTWSLPSKELDTQIQTVLNESKTFILCELTVIRVIKV